LRYLTAALVRLGSLAEARAIAADLMRLEPEFRLTTLHACASLSGSPRLARHTWKGCAR
jgi:hypothetical protein